MPITQAKLYKKFSLKYTAKEIIKEIDNIAEESEKYATMEDIFNNDRYQRKVL